MARHHHHIVGYDVLATLGYGARSTIFAVKDKDQHVYALKRLIKEGPSDQRFLDQAIHEHEICQKFDDPRLRKSIKLIKRRQVIRTTEVYVLMELVDGETLEQYTVKDLVELCYLCREIAFGLHSMHEVGYVHADMKPNNVIVVAPRKIKVIDFGQSCPIGTVKERIQGTPDYIAPEQVLRREIQPYTDVFNLGATMYWLLTRKHVPTLIPKGQAGLSIKTEDKCVAPMEVDPSIPPALSNLVMSCIETDPPQRPKNMKLVCDRLEMAIRQAKRQRTSERQQTTA